MNPGFWHANFYPTNFWHENFWQDFGGLTTTAVHIFSTANLDVNHISDSGNNVLFAGQTEAQGGGFFGGATNYWEVDANGIQTFSGTSAIHGLKVNTVRVTSTPYVPLITDDEIFVDTDGGAITINLPAGVEGKKYTIKNVGTAGNIVTVNPNGVELLIGENSGYVILDRGDDEQITYEPTEGWG
jgi:hypothetical protein